MKTAALALAVAFGATGTAKAAENARPDTAAMVAIPGGTFVQGVKSAAGGSMPVGAPAAHAVSVAPFTIDKTEVTAAQYATCVQAGACARPRFPAGSCTSGKGGDGDCAAACNINRGSAFATHPMNCATWEAARAFCAWAGKRLPTEPEWERAARGTDGRRYPWGKAPPNKQLCWNHGDVRVDQTCAVGSFAAGASPYGVLDLAGNVEEWTSTTYNAGADYVTKGGGFYVNGGDEDDDPPAWVFRADVAKISPPARVDITIGFRCARDGAAAASVTPAIERTAPATLPAGQASVAHPAPGSPMRKAILDALRAKLATTVEFKVARLNVVDDRAYFEGQEHKPGGRSLAALLSKSAAGWTVDELSISEADGGLGQTDRWQHDTSRKLPPELFAP